MKFHHKIWNVILSVIMLMTTIRYTGIQIHANSAPSRWTGTTGTGTIVSGEDCPIVVENETLIFDIQNFPEMHQEDYNRDTYDAKVSAKYTFSNPTDQLVDATLVFPFGQMPEYYNQQEASSYEVLVDEKPVTAQLRHTLMMPGETFDVDTAVSRLSDTLIYNDRYTPETKVMRYTYEIEDSLEAYPDAVITLQINDVKDSEIFTAEHVHVYDIEETQITLEYEVENNIVTLDLIGGTLHDLPQPIVYTDLTRKEQLHCNITMHGAAEFTLKEYLLQAYDSSLSISETDWYNASFTNLMHYAQSKFIEHEILENIRENLMQWYVYDISIQPHQTLTNTVTAPLYPDYQGAYSSPIYTYNYLLSPAKKWPDFHDLTIEVHTPYYLIRNSLGKMEETESGFKAHFDTLPEKEFVFELCEEQNPKSTSNIGTLLGMLAAMVIAGVGLIVLLIVMLVKLIRR